MPAKQITVERALTGKQKAFAVAYCGEAKHNKTLAAMLAGYTGGQTSLAVTGNRTFKNVKVQALIEAKMAEISAKTEDLRDKCVRKLVSIIDSPDARPAMVIKAIDIAGKMNGWHSQTTVLEAGQRQQQLTEAERDEARQLADLRFRPEYALPILAQEAQFEPVKADVSECEAGIEPTQGRGQLIEALAGAPGDDQSEGVDNAEL